jgi:hypothetical protein
MRAEAGRATSADWQDVAQQAIAVGSWREAIAASMASTGDLIDDRALEAYVPIAHGRDAAVSHGFTEEVGWFDYLAAEAAFASGEWDQAMTVGGRAVALGEANAYLRLTVRVWHILVPIAAARGDRATVDHAARWYGALEGKFEFPDSPYARVVRAAQDLEMADFGLWPAQVPEVEPRIASFGDDPSGPSWSAALDRVFRAWVEAGELDGAGRALAALDQAVERRPGVTRLGHGTHELLRARLALARGDDGAAAQAARAALDHFRGAQAPWWIAKAIRLLERAGAADEPLITEAAGIERRLGAGPTK